MNTFFFFRKMYAFFYDFFYESFNFFKLIKFEFLLNEHIHILFSKLFFSYVLQYDFVFSVKIKKYIML